MPRREGRLWQQFLQWFATAPCDIKRRSDAWRAFAAGYRLASGGEPNAETHPRALARNPFRQAQRERTDAQSSRTN